jgi:hypothetical protein
MMKTRTRNQSAGTVALLAALLACASAAHAQDTGASCRQFCGGDDRTCRAQARRQALAEQDAESNSRGRQEEAIGGNERRAASDEGIRSHLNERLDRCDQARTTCQRRCVAEPARAASEGG